MESTAPWEGACKMRGEPWPQSTHSSPLCWVSTSKVDFYIVDIPHELRWILLSIIFASSICRIHVLIVSLVTVGSLASTGHDHILKQHKIRLNLLILVYPITRGQKERGNQGTGPLQGTKTFCMKTSKSAALVQDFKVSRFQDFSWIFFLGSGNMSPFFVSLLCIYLETCYLSAESTRHFPPDKSLGKCFVRQQQLLEEYLREV